MTPEAAREIAELETAFERPAYWRCTHCHQPITGDGHTWTGPVRWPGESIWDQKRFHLDQPECQAACDAASSPSPKEQHREP